MTQRLDELTARRWRREGVSCPRRRGSGRPCAKTLEWGEGKDAPVLRCREHGDVYEVVRAA